MLAKNIVFCFCPFSFHLKMDNGLGFILSFPSMWVSMAKSMQEENNLLLLYTKHKILFPNVKEKSKNKLTQGLVRPYPVNLTNVDQLSAVQLSGAATQ